MDCDRNNKADTFSTPLVSVIVTTKNEELHIRNCLKSIESQNYPKEYIEIIVIDNQSTDRTKEIAQNFTSLVLDKGPERSAQRNFGITSISKGEYALFLDADMILAPNLIQACVQTIQQNKSVALHIPEIILGNNFWGKVRRFERRFYDGTVVDGVRFFRIDDFKKVGGFDESLCGPEDWDLDKKLKQLGNIGLVSYQPSIDWNHKIWSQSNFISKMGVDPSEYGGVIFHNESQFNLRTYLKKKDYYSRSIKRYVEKWGEDDPDIQKQLGLGYRFFWVFLERGKWKMLLAQPHLTFGMYFLRFLVGLSFLMRTSHE